MTADEWALVTDHLNSILERPEIEAEVLEGVPPGVRVEILRLLSAHRTAERDSAAADPPRVIAGRYELVGLLGTGGSAAAWLSRDIETGQRVVLKLPKQWEWFRQDLARQFHSEATILRGLEHPGIVAMLDSGATPEGAPFLVMPYIEGASLRTLLESGPLEPVTAATLIEQLGEAIQAAHRAGVIHRDIKPENVMIQRLRGEAPRAVLIDFGISLFSDFKEDSSTTTRFFGTSRYMAPEQLLGKPVMASDVYALALIAYEMRTGKPLLEEETPVALYEEQRRLRESQLGAAIGQRLPASVRAVLWEGLQANPAERPPIAQYAPKLAREIRNPSRQRWVPSRRALLAGAAVAVPGSAWLAYQNRPLSEADRTVVYKAGQTFDAVGWKKAGKIDLDVTVAAPDGSRILGNRLTTSDQGAYFFRLSPRVRAEGLRRRWRLTGDVMPIAGYSGFAACFREAGVRFLMTAEVPASGDSLITATESYTPELKKLRAPFQFVPGRFYQLEMTFDPNTRSARVAVDGRVVFEDYKGTHEYLEVPGIAVGFGLYQSSTAEAVYGDVTFVMD